MNLEHQIRTLEGAGYPTDEPEQKSSGLWLWAWAISGMSVLGLCLWFAWENLP